MNNRKETYKFLRECLNGTIDPMRVIEEMVYKPSEQYLKEKELAAIFAEDILYHAAYDPDEESFTEGQGTMTNWQR